MAVLPPDKLVPHAPLEAYVFDPEGEDWGVLLQSFSPPLPREGRVIVASFFGDVFVEALDGAVWWVNGLESRVDTIAADRESFELRLEQDHLVMLKTKLMEALIADGRLLKQGMVYGLKTPRSQGGKYDPDNVGAASLADAFAFMGAEFQRAANKDRLN